LCKVTGKFEHKRRPPVESKKIPWDELPNTPTSLVSRLTDRRNRPRNDSTKLLANDFWPIAREYIRPLIKEMPVTFVHGHTHQGGWGEFIDDEGREVRIYDLGGWVVHNKGHHPACHIFLVDENDREFLLDVSFKGATIDGEPLLKLAGDDAENKL
jgi:hypothetical protein